MKTLNKFTLMGNLARDPEIRAVGETMKATVTLAVEGAWNKAESKADATFLQVTIWDRGNYKAATWVSELSKGARLYVEGKIIHRSYEKDGAKVYVTELVADHVILPARGSGQTAPVSDTVLPEPTTADNIPF